MSLTIRDYRFDGERLVAAVFPILAFHPKVNLGVTCVANMIRAHGLTDDPQMQAAAALAAVVMTCSLRVFMARVIALHDTVLSVREFYHEPTRTKAMHVAANLMNLISSYSPTMLLVAIALQCLREISSTYQNYKNSRYFEMVCGGVVVYLRSKEFAVVRDQEGLGLRINQWAKRFFIKAHKLAVPIHKTIYNVYNGKRPSLYKGVSSVASAVASVACSTVGSALLYVSGKNYLIESIPGTSGSFQGNILMYNVGFLPGQLAQELTVGKFEMTPKKRQNEVIEFLVNEYRSKDLLLLEEVVDFRFVSKLEKALRTAGLAAHVYSRLGHPLVPGISSGLCIVSKTALDDLQVKNLPSQDPFFQRVFATFTLPNGSLLVHTHLRAKKALEQLAYITSQLSGKAYYLMGDCNLSDDRPENKIQESTMINPNETPSHPDFVGVWGGLVEPVIRVIRDFKLSELSDHFPVEVTTSVGMTTSS